MGTFPRRVPALAQASLEIYPTRSVYVFRDAGIELTATFLSPLLAEDLDVLSRPVSYLTFAVRSTDGKPHQTAIYVDASSEIAVDSTGQSVVWSRLRLDGLEALSIGTRDQPVLGRKGDDLRIDWGYFYLGIPDGQGARTALALAQPSREAFLAGGRPPLRDETAMPRPVDDGYPVAAASFDLGPVGAEAVSRRVLLAYDDRFSIEYFFRKLRPYWRRGGWEASDLLEAAGARGCGPWPSAAAASTRS